MDQLSIARTRQYGQVITIVAALSAIIYTIGLLRRSYFILALPVTLATAGALYIAFWIGRALMTTPEESQDF